MRSTRRPTPSPSSPPPPPIPGPAGSRRAPTATSGSRSTRPTRSVRSTRRPTPSPSSPIPTANPSPMWDHGGPRRQPLVHRDTGQPDRDDQPDDPRHHRVRHPHRRGSEPREITAGPDGNLWFTESTATRSARSTRRPTPSPSSPSPPPAPGRLGSRRAPTATSGSPSSTATKIGEINPTTHAITEFAIPTANSHPEEITAGPDGNLWFTEEKVGADR